MDRKIKRTRSRQGQAKKRDRRRFFFGLILVGLILVLGITYAAIYRSVHQHPEDLICDNIYIGEDDVSGMTRDEAMKVVTVRLSKERDKVVTMRVGDQTVSVNLQDLGYAYADMEGTVQEALAYGKEGNLFHRFFTLLRLNRTPHIVEETAMLSQSVARAVLNQEAVPLAHHAVDAGITVSEDGTLTVSDEAEGMTVDVDASIQAITEYLNQDWDHENFAIELVQTREEPAIKAADLTEVQDVLGTFSTDAGGGDRWQNLKTGAERINGTIVMPGETVSAHDLTAPYDAESGYVEAGSYENGQLVETYGGGICQVSTTLYNALLYAEVDIVKRYPHSVLVSYVDPSMDAAIAGTTKDLQFQNNYDTPLYISGEINSDNQLVFTIYGKETREEGRTLGFESETLSTEDYGTTYQTDSSLALGSMEESGTPHSGREAQLWKVVYQDGVEQSRDVINTSSYAKSDLIIKVGTKTDNSAAAAVIESAVATQDYATISEAISQAYGMD